MAGILNNKQRVFDFIFTDQGKEQLVNNSLEIKYASFTDRHTFYETSGSDRVATDASNRIMFEAVSRPSDLIVVEYDPLGKVKPFKAGDFSYGGMSVLTSSVDVVNSGTTVTQLTGTAILDAADGIIHAIANNFHEQQLLGTKDPTSPTEGFEVNQTQFTFTVDDSKPHPHGTFSDVDTLGVSANRNINVASVNSIESLFHDKRMAHLPNFRYLPPVNPLKPGETTPQSLGSYVNLNESPVMTIQELEETLSNKEYFDVEFLETSRDNNIIVQPFEFRSDIGFSKLAIIDYGEFEDEDPTSFGKRVFFLGKLLVDDFDQQTFVNVFTVVFD